MGDLPRHAALLGAVVAFCAGTLAGLLHDCPPLTAAARGALCAVVLGTVGWLAVRLALGVVAEGLRHRDSEAAEQ